MPLSWGPWSSFPHTAHREGVLLARCLALGLADGVEGGCEGGCWPLQEACQPACRALPLTCSGVLCSPGIEAVSHGCPRAVSSLN